MKNFKTKSLFFDNVRLTEIILKDGRSFKGYLHRQRFDPDIFEHSYIKLMQYDTMQYDTLFYIKDIESAITEGERISVTEIAAPHDLVESMRRDWKGGKEGKMEIPLFLMVEEEYRLPSEH